MAENLHKSILHGIFRILDVSQHGQGYAEYSPLMFSHEGFKGSTLSS